MHFRKLSSVAALLAVLMWNIPHFAEAHGGGGGGGGGGHGGGGFGGGGFGGGHGGFGGGFGGGHMGGFGGGHMGGFGGGHYGGMGGYGGGHYGGMGGYGLGGHSGMGGYSLGGHSGMGGYGLGGHSGFGSSAMGHSGALGGMSGGHQALGTVNHNPNSFTGQHLGSGATGGRVMSGYRGVGGATFAGTHAQGLLSHQATNPGGHSSFMQHHNVGTGTGGRGGASGLASTGGAAGMHHGGMMGQHHGGMMGNHHGMNNNNNNNNFNRGFGGFGFYPFFGFGFPFFGLGYGLYGLGYGLGGYGFGGYGLGGYGYGGYGYGYNPYAYNYGPYGYGYGGYGYPYGNAYPNAQTAPTQPAQPTVKASDAEVFAQKGENDFKAGDYKAAVYAWKHALVDDPQNGVLMMMLAQGLFAQSNFNEAAGAVQQAMMLLPEDQWGVVVANYRELYGKVGDYTTQLRALEKAVKAAPDDAGTRFLLGYHYGFLGYPQQAVKQLDKTLQLQPGDQLAKKLRDQFQAKLPAGVDGQGGGQGGAGGGHKAQPNGNQADDKTAGDGKAADAKGARARPQMERYDAIVVGVGGVGSAVLCHLARRGVRVLGLDRFPPGHDRGSSHGSTRIIRRAYFEHAGYVPLLLRAWELWAELSAEWKQPLLDEVGLLQIGPAEGAVVPKVMESARIHGLDVEQVPPRDIAARWPGFHAHDGLVGAYERRAGYLRVEEGVEAHIAAALAAGAELRCDRAVVAWRSEGSGIAVKTDREEICADRLVITAGPWAGDLLADFAVRLTVLRKPVFWLATCDDTYRTQHGAPCFLYELPSGIFYGIPQIDDRGVKVAEHSGGEQVGDPLHVDRAQRVNDYDRVARFAADYLPRATAQVRHHSVCMYTMTSDQHFIVDRHPSFDRVVLVAGLSGHGYKFAPVLGEIAADLALEGATRHPIGFLRLDRFHAP